MNEKELQNVGVSVHAGFPNAASGSSAKTLDIGRMLVPHPAATYLMRLDSNTWRERGIFAGDIVVIDRALNPKKTDFIVWWEGEDFYIGLPASLPKDTPTWGTVRSVIHQYRNP